jgi:SAM-dependent methyltransferase
MLQKFKSYSINEYVIKEIKKNKVSKDVLDYLYKVSNTSYPSIVDFEQYLSSIPGIKNEEKGIIINEAKVFQLKRFYFYFSSLFNTYFPKSRLLPNFFTYISLSRVIFPLRFRFRAFYLLTFKKVQEKKNANLEGFDHNRKQLLGFLEGHRNRTESLINILRSVQGYDFKNMRLLCVGPRNEAEVMLLHGYGFKKTNVEAIDLFSYSPYISVMDMNNLQYPNDSFDIYYSSAVIKYSSDVHKTVSESLRVTKTGGLMAFCFTFGVKSDLVPSGAEFYNGLKDLFKLYDKYIETIYWQEEFFHSEGDTRATAIFKIKK